MQREIAAGYERLAELQGGGAVKGEAFSFVGANLGQLGPAIANYRKAAEIREQLLRRQPLNRELRQEWIASSEKLLLRESLSPASASQAAEDRRRFVDALTRMQHEMWGDPAIVRELQFQAVAQCAPSGALLVLNGASAVNPEGCRKAAEILREVSKAHPGPNAVMAEARVANTTGGPAGGQTRRRRCARSIRRRARRS